MSKPDIVKDASDSEPIDTELLARAEMALLTLPRFTREVLLAHRIDDLSYADIASITGTSKRRIEKAMARAIHGIDRAMSREALRWGERRRGAEERRGRKEWGRTWGYRWARYHDNKKQQ